MGEGKAILAAHRVWGLRCWPYINSNRRHSSILMWLQKSDLIFGTESDVMRPAYKFEPYYRVIILTTEHRPETVGLPLQLRDLSVMEMRPGRLLGGLRLESVGRIWVEVSVALYEVLPQIYRHIYIYICVCVCVCARACARARYLASAYVIQTNATREKYIRIVSDTQAALKALQDNKTPSQLEQRHQKPLNDFLPINPCYCSVYRTSWERWKRQRRSVCHGIRWSPVCLIKIDLGGLQPEYKEKY